MGWPCVRVGGPHDTGMDGWIIGTGWIHCPGGHPSNDSRGRAGFMAKVERKILIKNSSCFKDSQMNLKSRYYQQPGHGITWKITQSQTVLFQNTNLHFYIFIQHRKEKSQRIDLRHSFLSATRWYEKTIVIIKLCITKTTLLPYIFCTNKNFGDPLITNQRRGL
jgi:hypothetical protein